MDRHFETAPLDQNLPVLMALITIWNRNFLGCPALAVLPYNHRLRLLPGHLQQLIMESNGKGVRADGAPVSYDTAPLVFGGPGPESQHSFLQMIHQSPMVVPVDFIIALDGQGSAADDQIFANCLAQSEALMRGLAPDGLAQDSAKNLAAHTACPGGRPSTTLLLNSLTPETIGALIALYEHKTFVEGTLWGLNSFDQWGVELGKTLAKTLLPHLTAQTDPPKPTPASLNPADTGRNSSTMALLTAYRDHRKKTRP
jgi:glucose-6-phosphate isomerase